MLLSYLDKYTIVGPFFSEIWCLDMKPVLVKNTQLIVLHFCWQNCVYRIFIFVFAIWTIQVSTNDQNVG